MKVFIDTQVKIYSPHDSTSAIITSTSSDEENKNMLLKFIRYTGFCPSLREHFGQTYGKATRHILKEQPNLKDRLSAVHYHSKREREKLKNLKPYDGHEKDYSRGEPAFTFRDKHFDDYKDGDRFGKTLCDKHMRNRRDEEKRGKKEDDRKMRDRKGAEREERSRYFRDFKEGNGIRKKEWDNYVREYRSDDKKRYAYDCMCPRYFCVAEVRECIPESWSRKDRGDLHYFHHHPSYKTETLPCSEDPKHKSNEKMNYCPDHLRRKPRIVQHRYGGVIPKYTGHIPGMDFTFGESYGPISDKLLRRHQDNMARSSRRL